MKQTENTKAYYYFDEAGDPNILGRKGVNLIEKGFASKEIPSIKKTANMFHATDDCPEVRSEVFKLLKNSDFTFYCIVARKNIDLFRKKFDLKPAKLYEYLVTKLLEDRLHLYKEIDLYFSAMGNTVRQHNMNNAVNSAVKIFEEKWKKKNESNIRIFIQQTNEITLLQAADYVLWTIQRAYQNNDFRYYNYLKDKICLVHDIFDFEKYPKNYYTQKNPLEAKKIDPV